MRYPWVRSSESVCRAPRRRQEEWKVLIMWNKLETTLATPHGFLSPTHSYTGSEVIVTSTKQPGSSSVWDYRPDLKLHVIIRTSPR